MELVNKPKHHVIITGTGRAGTTFLVELLTHLGQDTGFTVEGILSHKYKEADAGLEYRLTDAHTPYFVKHPEMHEYLEKAIETGISIDYAIIPIRSLKDAVNSRREVHRRSLKSLSFRAKLHHIFIRRRQFPGGLVRDNRGKEKNQEHILMAGLYKTLLVLSRHQIPITFVQYPLLISDANFLYRKLQPILSHIEFEQFAAVYAKLVRYKEG